MTDAAAALRALMTEEGCGNDEFRLLDEALAAERRATVDRIRERLDSATSHGALGIGSHVYSGMLAILDDEATGSG